MHIRRSPYRCAFHEHDLEAYGRTEKRCRMGVGGGGGGTASSRTTTVPNGKLRGGRRKRRRPDGRHERARSLAKRIRVLEGVKKVLNLLKALNLMLKKCFNTQNHEPW